MWCMCLKHMDVRDFELNKVLCYLVHECLYEHHVWVCSCNRLKFWNLYYKSRIQIGALSALMKLIASCEKFFRRGIWGMENINFWPTLKSDFHSLFWKITLESLLVKYLSLNIYISVFPAFGLISGQMAFFPASGLPRAGWSWLKK